VYWFDAVVLALAVWRLSSLIVYERGPFDVFQKVRERVGIQHDDAGMVTATPETLLGGIFGCLWCLSVYVGLIAALCAYFWPSVTFWLALPLALSGGAILVERMASP
jgi:hypothetical protein